MSTVVTVADNGKIEHTERYICVAQLSTGVFDLRLDQYCIDAVEIDGQWVGSSRDTCSILHHSQHLKYSGNFIPICFK